MDMRTSPSMTAATSMSGMSPASTAAMSMSTGSSMGDMGGMDMGSGACKISMLWNWFTVDACFLSSTWHVTSPSMFAGSCIGVICLVISLEFLRRVQREFENYIARSNSVPVQPSSSVVVVGEARNGGGVSKKAESSSEARSPGSSEDGRMGGIVRGNQGRLASGRSRTALRLSLLQQAGRATIHMLQFAVAYFIMLLAMYYNGYIILCIFIGAWIGSFSFSWDQLGTSTQRGDATEVTGCCG